MNFIETYDNALTSEMCKKIIDFFDFAPPEIKKEGETYLTKRNLEVESYVDWISSKGLQVDKKKVKESTDITMNFNQQTEPDQIIASAIHTCIEKYKEKHVEIDNIAIWSLTHNYNIQKYKPTQGYHLPHCECADGGSTRILAWMIYLNTVTDKGGTRFTNYDIITDAVEGRLLIWPAYWTHTHHGVASPTQTKYIATGWFEFT